MKREPDPEFEPADALVMWVITHNLSDLPGPYVARKWVWNERAREMIATAESIQTPDLDGLRKTLVVEYGMALPIERAPNDDPVIVETWI